MGPTGSGKSTFVKLVQRLHDLQGRGDRHRRPGRLEGDPGLLAPRHRGGAAGPGLVPPQPVREHRLRQAGRHPRRGRGRRPKGAAHEFIPRLPQGYDTLVGERGVKLSGGERQRVAIARAFLADAPILVLDEATSSLDVETEVRCRQPPRRWLEGRTTIVIAHRLSTVRGADRILVFQGGRVVEEGRHAELAAGGGVYARLNAISAGRGLEAVAEQTAADGAQAVGLLPLPRRFAGRRGRVRDNRAVRG
ncbi:ATP-binding cassette domain-containing protein [Caulobacter segnis]